MDGAGIRRPEGVGSMVMLLSSGTKRQERKPTTITGWEAPLVGPVAGSRVVEVAGAGSRVVVAPVVEVGAALKGEGLAAANAWGAAGSRKYTALSGAGG